MAAGMMVILRNGAGFICVRGVDADQAGRGAAGFSRSIEGPRFLCWTGLLGNVKVCGI